MVEVDSWARYPCAGGAQRDGAACNLTAAQQKQVFRWTNGKNPMQYGFDFGLWTRAVVRELILKRFAVSLSVTSVGILLARFGPTPQKLLQCACRRDQQAVERWQREIYPAIVRQARQTGADIRFWDESGFRADAVQGKTWGTRVRRRWCCAPVSARASARLLRSMPKAFSGLPLIKADSRVNCLWRC